MTTGTNSGMSLGVVLFTAGAILTWALEVDIPYVNEHALGIVLMIVGVLALVISIVQELQKTRSRHVVEHRNTTDQYGNGTQPYSRY